MAWSRLPKHTFESQEGFDLSSAASSQPWLDRSVEHGRSNHLNAQASSHMVLAQYLAILQPTPRTCLDDIVMRVTDDT